jgi:hypothetical protein
VFHRINISSKDIQAPTETSGLLFSADLRIWG